MSEAAAEPVMAKEDSAKISYLKSIYKPWKRHGVTLKLEGAQVICNIDIRALAAFQDSFQGWVRDIVHHNATDFILILSASTPFPILSAFIVFVFISCA